MGDSFPQVKLADVAHIIMGQSPKGETYNKIGDGIPLLNGPTEFGFSHPIPELWTTSPTRLCRQGDLLFCVRGSTTGRMNWADREYCLGRGVGVFRAKTDQTDTRFVYYTLIFELSRLLSFTSGSVFPNLSRQDFEQFIISWPDKHVRSAIASILGALDDKIELNRKMNETLEAMARAIFKSWFTYPFEGVKGIPSPLPSPTGRGCQELTGEGELQLVDSPLGKIPKGWRMGNLSEIVELHRDSINPISFPNEIFEHYSIPAFDERQMPTQDLGSTIKSNKFLLPHKCILISKLNPRIPRIWFPSINKNCRSVASTEFLVLVPKVPYSCEFIYSLCISSVFQDFFISLVTGTSSSHQRVKPEDLLSIKITCPSDIIVEEFTKKVLPLFANIQSTKEQSLTLASIRDSLLPKLLSGEIRVKDAERFVEAKV